MKLNRNTIKRFLPIQLLSIWRFLRKSYLLATNKSLTLDFDQRAHNFDILIFQMGRVGSNTVEKTLIKSVNKKIVRTHCLELGNWYDVFDINLPRTLADPLSDEILKSSIIKNELNKKPNFSKKRYIITMAREPISFFISAFFQNLWQMYPDLSTYKGKKYVLTRDIISKIKDQIEIYLSGTSKYDDPLTKYIQHFIRLPLVWYDNELQPLTGIDIYDHPFPKEKGYIIIESNRYNILLIRFENLFDCLETTLKTFFDTSKIKIIPSNLSQKKDYKASYNEVLRTIDLPKKFINMQLESKFVRHFYSEKEIQEIRKKWYKNRILE